MIKLAAKAASKPNRTSKKVATKLCKALLAISLKVLLANRHPTEAPRISNNNLLCLVEADKKQFLKFVKIHLQTKCQTAKLPEF